MSAAREESLDAFVHAVLLRYLKDGGQKARDIVLAAMQEADSFHTCEHDGRRHYRSRASGSDTWMPVYLCRACAAEQLAAGCTMEPSRLMKREPGFYWVRIEAYGDEAQIAQMAIGRYTKPDGEIFREDEAWQLCGEEDIFDSPDVEVLSERLTPP